MLFQRYGEAGLYTRRPFQTAHWRDGQVQDGRPGAGGLGGEEGDVTTSTAKQKFLNLNFIGPYFY